MVMKLADRIGPAGRLRGAAVVPPPAHGPLPMLAPARPCSVDGCTATLSRYNEGPKCFAHQHAENEQDSARRITTEERLLTYLGRRPRTANWLAARLHLTAPTVRAMCEAHPQIERGQERGDEGKFRTVYRLTDEAGAVTE